MPLQSVRNRDYSAENRRYRKSIVIVCFMVSIALLHVVTGSHYAGPFPEFVNGYMIDILLPAGLYLLLCPQDEKVRFLRPWYVKAIPVFLIGALVETLQYLGYPVFGRTFDPLDYLMVALGAGLGALLDKVLFPWLFPFWKPAAGSLED